MASVILKNVCKNFNEQKTIINNINLEIKDKEFVVFVGPSGCGKTTMLRMIAGLEDVSSGEILIDEKVVNNLPASKRDIAMVFQNYALYPHMNVKQNLSFALKISKTKKEIIDKKVENVAKILGLSDYLDKKPNALSGGQRQRVALGRAMVRNPKVFLLDEPLSNLDAKLRTNMRSEIVNLHKKLEATFIYVTHDQIEAMTMGSKIAVLNDGEIEQFDTPRNLYQNPVNKFVAEFIGNVRMNFFSANLIKEGEKIFIKFNELKKELNLKFKDENLKFVENKIEILIGIRAENFIINDKSCEFSFKADIINTEDIGSDVFLHFQFKDEKFIARSDKIVDNGSINFGFNLKDIYIFDKITQIALIKR